MALPSMTPNPCSAKTAPMMMTTIPAAISKRFFMTCSSP
jgi:hypothetical protein